MIIFVYLLICLFAGLHKLLQLCRVKETE